MGWDFVDNDSDPMETTYKDWQNSGKPEISPESGSSYYTSHGTHVSGTIGGTGENKESDFATVGVAPEADLYGYRVLGPYGSGYTSDIVAAIEKSVEDGMDVINLSLGANINDPLYPTAVATNNAMRSGVVTVLANGNAGPNPGTVGTPGTAPLPISVGASTTSIKLSTFDVKASNGTQTKGRLLSRDFTTDLNSISEGEVVLCGLGDKGEFPSEVKGNIALIQRGNLSLNEKVMNAKNAGAKAVILYNNVDGEIEHYLGESKGFVTGVSIDKQTGEKLRKEIEESGSNKLKIKLNVSGEIGTDSDLLADFSSRGPVNNGDIKPDVVAPGVAIMSTYPEFINNPQDGENYEEAYARISGTSMAAPHVAGLSALILQENEKYNPFDVKLALMNTSDDLKKDYGVNEMGAGRINAVDAVNSKLVIKNKDKVETVDENGEIIEIEHETGAISFGTVGISKKTINIKDELIISNQSNKTQTFDVSVEYVTPSKSNGAQDAIKNKVKLEVKEVATASKNKETKLGVNLIIPKGAEEGIYQGYIKLVNSRDKSQTHNIPFSVKYVEPGLAPIEISSNSVTNDLDWVHPWLSPGIAANIKINTPVEKMDIVVRDYQTNQLIGYRGTLDASMLSPGVTYELNDALNMILSVYPIGENNEISPLSKKLEEGKYKLEFIATDKEGNTTSKSQPFIVDNTPAKVTNLTLESGVHEINESMFTTEKDDSGVEHNALWVKGKVDDSSINILNNMGVNAKLSDIAMMTTVNGYPNTTFKVNDDGSYKFGITMDDVEYGGMELRTLPLDMAGSLNYNQVPKYFFMKEGEPYIYTKSDKKEVSENEEVTITMDINNIKNASTFNLKLEYLNGYKLIDVKLNEKAKDILKEKGYTVELSHEDISMEAISEVKINAQIKDSEGNKVNIDGDIPLVDAVFKLEDDTNMDMYSSYFLSTQPKILDKDGNKVDLYSRIVYDTITNKQNSSTIMIGESAEGIIESGRYDLENFEQYIWVEDSKGNKYPCEFDDAQGIYYAKNLPVTEDEFTVVAKAPGHFKNQSVSTLYRNVDGELVGKSSYLYYEYASLAGDANEDGVIDLKDAQELEKVYNKTENIEGRDFNFDGKVNKTDMEFVVRNYQVINPQEESAPAPEEDKDGLKLKSILDKIGYNN